MVALLMTVGMSACAYFEPVPYISSNETMSGPGIFSGESGECILIEKE